MTESYVNRFMFIYFMCCPPHRIGKFKFDLQMFFMSDGLYFQCIFYNDLQIAAAKMLKRLKCKTVSEIKSSKIFTISCCFNVPFVGEIDWLIIGHEFKYITSDWLS